MANLEASHSRMKGLEQSGRPRMGAVVRAVLRDWKAVSAAGDQRKGTLPVREVEAQRSWRNP